jgi:ABC-type uncharacterized transport system ATPase subunit
VNICDRIYVLRQGHIVDELLRNEISKESILASALTGSASEKNDGSPKTESGNPQLVHQGG